MNGKRKGKEKSLLLRLIAWLHLWPSIVAGVVILLVCLTGTLLVYADEILSFSAGSAEYVEEVDDNRISADQILENIERAYPGYMVSEYVFFKDKKRSIRLRIFNPEERSLAYAYMNPYTGELIEKDHTIFFFFIVAHIHAQLLAGKVGGWLVICSTIVFTISCITGLVLWWPKRWTKATRKASFTIKWKARFKRLNYDLHNVLGFYSLIPALILSITGLMIYYPSLMNQTIKASGGNMSELIEVLPKLDSTKSSIDMVPFAYEVLEREENPKEEVSIWNFDMRKMGTYVFTSGKVGLKSIEKADITVYDRYSGDRIMVDPSYIRHEKTKNTIWQLHMGQWFGRLGKFITFLVGLVTTSLSITGFLIWWPKWRKKSKRDK